METMHAYFKTLERYTDFTGRTSRGEYRIFTAIDIAIKTAFFWGGFACRVTLDDGTFLTPWSKLLLTLGFLYMLATLLPALAISTRRLHDVGRAGWEQYTSYRAKHIMWWQEGQNGANRYGSSPQTPRKE